MASARKGWRVRVWNCLWGERKDKSDLSRGKMNENIRETQKMDSFLKMTIWVFFTGDILGWDFEYAVYAYEIFLRIRRGRRTKENVVELHSFTGVFLSCVLLFSLLVCLIWSARNTEKLLIFWNNCKQIIMKKRPLLLCFQPLSGFNFPRSIVPHIFNSFCFFVGLSNRENKYQIFWFIV